MTLRPKIVKLIDRYSQKKSAFILFLKSVTILTHVPLLSADLLAMNDSFMKARKVYDQVMEESLAKYNPGGEHHTSFKHKTTRSFVLFLASLQDYNPQMGGPPGGQPYGWNPNLYNGQYGGPQQPPNPAQYNPQQPPYDQQQQHPYPQQDPSQQYVQPYGAPPGQPQLDRQTSYAPSQYAPTPNPYDTVSQSPPPGVPGYGQHQPPPQGYQSIPPQQQQQPQQPPLQQRQSTQAPPAGAFSPAVGQAPYARPGSAMPDVQAQSPLWAAQQQQQHPPPQPQQYQPMQPPAQTPTQYAPTPNESYTPTQAPPQSQPSTLPQRQPSISRGPLPQPGQPTHPVQQQQPGLHTQPSFNVTSATPTSPLAHTSFSQHQQQQQAPYQQQIPEEPAARAASPPQQQAPPANAQPSMNFYQQQQETHPQPTAQPEVTPVYAQQQPEPASQAVQAEPQPEPTPAPAAAASPPPGDSNLISGPPPYPWDPTKKYADAGADAWAQYYAKGGTDPAGKVYFIPGTLPDAAGQTNGVGGAGNPESTSPTGVQRALSYGPAGGAVDGAADPHARAGSQSPVQQQYGAQRQTSSGEPNFAGRMSHQYPGGDAAQHQTAPHAQFMH